MASKAKSFGNAPRQSTFGYGGERSRLSRADELNTLIERLRVLIICEGEKTEPNYFRSFRVQKQVVELNIAGLGMNTLRLVEETEKIATQGAPFDAIWCVFDRDSFPPDNFDNAIHRCRAKGWNIAYSNEAFELWYLLHLEKISDPHDRNWYKSRLNELMGNYKKNSPRMRELLRSKAGIDAEQRAIRWAGEMCAAYEDTITFHRRKPSTTVYELVAKLREWEI